MRLVYDGVVEPKQPAGRAPAQRRAPRAFCRSPHDGQTAGSAAPDFPPNMNIAQTSSALSLKAQTNAPPASFSVRRRRNVREISGLSEWGADHIIPRMFIRGCCSARLTQSRMNLHASLPRRERIAKPPIRQTARLVGSGTAPCVIARSSKPPIWIELKDR